MPETSYHPFYRRTALLITLGEVVDRTRDFVVLYGRYPASIAIHPGYRSLDELPFDRIDVDGQAIPLVAWPEAVNAIMFILP